MNNKKIFTICAVLFLIIGISMIFVKNIQISKTVSTSSTTVEKIEETPGAIIQNEKNIYGSRCLSMEKNITTQTVDDEIVAEYEEYIFGCFCNGKLADKNFVFKSSNPFAGPNCEKRCAKLCQNK